MDALSPRPADLCRELLAVLAASEGRRRRRQRDTTPDAIGLGIKRSLLEQAIADDPAPEAFEGWLLGRCLEAASTVSVGAVRAMALDVLTEWRLVAADPAFRSWLASGAPSDDAGHAPAVRTLADPESRSEDPPASRPDGA